MRWLVVGAAGMLGQDLTALLQGRGHDVVGVDRDVVDITDAVATAGLSEGFEVVANVAAYTAVDRAESEESAAFAVNAVGPANLAREVARSGARLVHVSTDYVFGGDSDQPYDEAAPLAPASAYGRTKAAGEWAVRAGAPDHLVVRTAWLYGARGQCFPKTIARVASERGSLTVVDDQVGQPTWTVDLADLIERMVRAGLPSGTYHGTSGGAVSWFGFARAVVEAAGLDPDMVQPTTTDVMARRAHRPAFSVLGHEALTSRDVRPIRAWDDAWRAAAADVLGAREG